MLDFFVFPWRGPYRWRTNLRTLLPRLFGGIFDKGKDCESAGGDHEWYNQDNENSACYHCRVVRPGQLWRRDSTDQNQSRIDQSG